MFLQVDTGSTDIWVDVAGSAHCAQHSDLCVFGIYDNTTSSSYQYVNSLFHIGYVDLSSIEGDYALETFNFAGLFDPRSAKFNIQVSL